MKKFAIIINDEIVHKYEAESEITFGGKWGTVPHVEYDSTWEHIKLESGSIVENTEKKDLISENDRLNNLIKIGRNNEDCCREVRLLINGYNATRSLSTEQINSMLSTFADINTCLKEGMPQTALSLVKNIVADGTIITNEMLTDAKAIFKRYGFE